MEFRTPEQEARYERLKSKNPKMGEVYKTYVISGGSTRQSVDVMIEALIDDAYPAPSKAAKVEETQTVRVSEKPGKKQN